MAEAQKKDQTGLRLAIDYLPLLVFFAVTFLIPEAVAMKLVASFSGMLNGMDQMKAIVISRVIVATGAFVIATIVAMLVSRIRLGTISPMLWITGALVVVFGGLTMYFADPHFIQMKPTFVYLILAAILFFGMITGRPMLEQLLGTAYPGLTELGWRKVTRNWALFFAGMAVLNEIARAALSYNAWVLFKFPGCAILSLVFAAANIPMLMKHGLSLEDDKLPEVPPEG